MEVLKIKNLTKKFNKQKVLDKVNLRVEEGEVYGLVGPHGSGKSVILRIIIGLLEPTKGKVKVFGKDAWYDAVEIHKRVAYIPRDVEEWCDLTGMEVLELFAGVYGSKKEEDIIEIAEKFSLDPNKKCGAYSKGSIQRLALVATLVTDADFYVLDEPTSGLDPVTEKVLEEYLLEAKSEGKTILMLSHGFSKIEKLCDYISVIDEGKIIKSGTVEELVNFSRTRITVRTKRMMNELEQKEGVYNIKVIEDDISFEVDQDNLDNIMVYVSDHGILKIESIPLTLEELFNN